ncbi:hypothetical protein ACAG26_25570 [Mycobacterium sp. pUA109]|uniref:hypothetical protein n=1 Tax=Mycobacterium sp. pUA109 TaxID=3238982 RepID=UPI00351AB475
MPVLPQAARTGYVTAVLVVFGGYSAVVGLCMMVAPGAFFDSLGAFGVRNDHYIFDAGSFELPLGLLLLAALRLPTWRPAALAYATAHWALHALSHGLDTDHADGRSIGLAEFGGLAIGTIALGVAVALTLPRHISLNDKEDR